MQKPAGLPRVLVLRGLAAILGTFVALLLLEMLGRVVFFQKKSVFPVAIVWLYDELTSDYASWRVASQEATVASGGKVAVEELEGPTLNEQAWRATFEDRGLKPHPNGPREGYWGVRVEPKHIDRYLGVTERQLLIPGLVNVDAQGFQCARDTHSNPALRILILGGSVGYGAYASTEDHSYFCVLHRALTGRGIANEVLVLAAGGWTSYDEVRALVLRGIDKDPDLVIFLDGLNDLTNHEAPWSERAEDYLRNMHKSKIFLAGYGKQVVFALQPFLPAKKALSRYERRIMETTPHANELAPFYQQIREGLRQLDDGRTAHFVDCSNVLSDERPTTFADIWHFTDPAHAILGEFLASEVQRIVDKAGPRRGGAGEK